MAGPATGHAVEHGSHFTDHAHWLEMIPGFRALDQRVGEAMQFFHVGASSGGDQQSAYQVFMALVAFTAITAALLKAGINRLGVEERIVPESTLTIRTCFELVVESVLGMMRDIIGPTADRFLPLIGTLAIFIFVSNVLALVPGFQPATANLNTTLALALPVFFATHFFGVKEHGLAYFKHFFGPILKWYALPLMAIMLLIEIISHLARPLSLSLRLLGNMYGDHQVFAVFMGLLAVPLLYPIPVVALGLIVCIVQTLVFCLLSMVYIGLAVAHEDH